MAARRKAPTKAKCNMNFGYGLVALVIIALGIYGLVNGFALHLASIQSDTQNYGTILVWYFAGLLLFKVGKMAKWKAHANCPVHKGMM